MKRFHLHVGVKDLNQSVEFYSTLFGQRPSKLKADYAKWMLDDPRINFAISTLTQKTGVDHLGIQVDDPAELEELTERLKKADLGVFGEGETTCCYAKSDKAWVEDPAGVAWEAYRTMEDAEVYQEKAPSAETECCGPQASADTDAGEESCCG